MAVLPPPEKTLKVPAYGLELGLWPGVDRPLPAIVQALPRLPVKAGQLVLDLGCGSGLFSLLAAKAGASVLATDIDPRALAATAENAMRHGFAKKIETRQSELYAALAGNERFNLIIANLPQTPCPAELHRSASFSASKWGGPDGRNLLDKAWRGSRTHLKPGGAVFTLQIGWLDWAAIDTVCAGLGFAVKELGRGLRPFSWEEYEGYAPGLPAAYRALIASGRAQRPQEQPDLAFPFRWHLSALPAP